MRVQQHKRECWKTAETRLNTCTMVQIGRKRGANAGATNINAPGPCITCPCVQKEGLWLPRLDKCVYNGTNRPKTRGDAEIANLDAHVSGLVECIIVG